MIYGCTGTLFEFENYLILMLLFLMNISGCDVAESPRRDFAECSLRSGSSGYLEEKVTWWLMQSNI